MFDILRFSIGISKTGPKFSVNNKMLPIGKNNMFKSESRVAIEGYIQHHLRGMVFPDSLC